MISEAISDSWIDMSSKTKRHILYVVGVYFFFIPVEALQHFFVGLHLANGMGYSRC